MEQATVSGIKIAFKQSLCSSTRQILFIHGFFGSANSWSSQQSFFAANGFGSIAVDLPGFGASDKGSTIDYSHSGLAALLTGLVETPLHVVGNGFGGRIALSMALLRPDLVRSITLAGATVHQPSLRLLFMLPGTTWLFRRALHLWWRDKQRFCNNISQLYDCSDAMLMDPILEERWSRYSDPSHLDTVVYMARDAWKSPLSGRLREIQCPVQFLWGEQDKLEEIELAHEMRDQMVCKARLDTIANAGHFAHECAADPFNKHLLAFLQDQYSV